MNLRFQCRESDNNSPDALSVLRGRRWALSFYKSIKKINPPPPPIPVAPYCTINLICCDVLYDCT